MIKSDGLHLDDGTIIPRRKGALKPTILTPEQETLKMKWHTELCRDYPDACPKLLEWAVEMTLTDRETIEGKVNENLAKESESLEKTKKIDI